MNAIINIKWSKLSRADRAAAYDELRASCAVIDVAPEAADAEPLNEEARVLLKMEVYEAWRRRHGVSTGRNKGGGLKGIEVLRAIGHPEVERTPAIEHALSEMRERNRLPGPIRHEPETEVDRLIDKYEKLLVEREYGPPRDPRRTSIPSKDGAAREMECPREMVDEIAMRRLRLLSIKHPVGKVEKAKDAKIARQRIFNPAVDVLLNGGLKTFTGGLPQDPLYPEAVDRITVCERSGIGVTDVLGSNDRLARIEQARGDLPLVPNPLLTTRCYTFADLIEWARDEKRETEDQAHLDETGMRHEGVATRKHVHALRGLLNLPGVTLREQDLVPYDLKELIERAVIASYRSFAPGWRSLIAGWIKWNDAFRATKPIADTFALTLRILCREAGLTPHELDRHLSRGKPKAKTWASGESLPSSSAQEMLVAVATRLRVPMSRIREVLPDQWRTRKFGLGQLTKRKMAARSLPISFHSVVDDDEKKAKLEANHWLYVRQGSVFGRRHSAMAVDIYALQYEEWQPEMRAAWEALIPERKDEDAPPLRRFGDALLARDDEGKIKDDPDGWADATIEMRQKDLSYLFGYMVRAREVEAGEEQVTDGGFQPEGGLGIPPKLLKPSVLALTNLITAFAWWRVRRSGAFVNTIVSTFRTVSNMLRPGLGAVWKSPEMLADLEAFVDWWKSNPHATAEGRLEFDIEPFRRNWQEAVTAAYTVLRDDIHRATRKDLKPSRDTFFPVGVFVEHPRPMELYMKGVRAMLASKPLTIEARHVHTRDCITTMILVQTGLRAYNMVFTFDDGTGLPKIRRKGRNGKVLQPTLMRKVIDGEVKWLIDIPSSEFKNWRSAYFKGKRPYQYELRNEDGLYALMERYVTLSRPYMLKGRKSDAFFISSKGSDMNSRELSAQYRIAVARHFIHNPDTGTGAVVGAIAHSMHVVRNVIATHIVKTTGDLYLAAWAIQDSPRTVEKHYARFIPKDKAEHAARILAEARAVGSLKLAA